MSLDVSGKYQSTFELRGRFQPIDRKIVQAPNAPVDSLNAKTLKKYVQPPVRRPIARLRKPPFATYAAPEHDVSSGLRAVVRCGSLRCLLSRLWKFEILVRPDPRQHRAFTVLILKSAIMDTRGTQNKSKNPIVSRVS